MKKIILLCILIALSIAVFAQSPRLISMGSVYGYIDDDYDIFTYPATINSYAKNVYGYLGSSCSDEYSYNFGFNCLLSKFVLGVYFNKPLPSMALNNYVEQSYAMLDKRFQMFLGLNENIAATFSLAMDSYTAPSRANEDTENAMALGFGIGYSTDKFDLGANILLPSYSTEDYFIDNNSIEQKESKSLIDIAGRMLLTEYNSREIIGKVNLHTGSSTFDDGVNNTNDIESSYMAFDLGFAGLLNIDDDNLLVIGITPFGLHNAKTESGTQDYTETSTTNTIMLPAFNIGLESKICKWLVVRSGIIQNYLMVTETDEYVDDNGKMEETIKYKDSHFDFKMGMGMFFKNFTLDFVFNERFLHNGPNFITGAVTENVIGKLMLKYSF
jgi:hypothetical protein